MVILLISFIYLSQDADKNVGDDSNVPTPLPLEELAPAPNMDDIFGKFMCVCQVICSSS